jgi:metal-responsive CopG/Arc/MetJ family transcriptional regulator
MSTVKTAISLPEPLFERADAFAQRQRISRSQLFARAVEEFLRRHESQVLLEALDRVYGDFSPSPEDTEARRLMKQKQQERLKGDW